MPSLAPRSLCTSHGYPEGCYSHGDWCIAFAKRCENQCIRCHNVDLLSSKKMCAICLEHQLRTEGYASCACHGHQEILKRAQARVSSTLSCSNAQQETPNPALETPNPQTAEPILEDIMKQVRSLKQKVQGAKCEPLGPVHLNGGTN